MKDNAQERQAGPDSVDKVRSDFAASHNNLNVLAERVAASPQNASLEPLRKRLLSLENLYQQVGSAVNGLSSPSSPQQLLQLQQDVYRLNESLGVVTKMVEQVTTGVKTILQTQI